MSNGDAVGVSLGCPAPCMLTQGAECSGHEPGTQGPWADQSHHVGPAEPSAPELPPDHADGPHPPQTLRGVSGWALCERPLELGTGRGLLRAASVTSKAPQQGACAGVMRAHFRNEAPRKGVHDNEAPWCWTLSTCLPHKAVGGRSPFYGARNEACSGPAGPKARQLECEGTRCTRRD